MAAALHKSLLWDEPGEPVNVLLLDDDPRLLDVCEKALTRAGFTVNTAREGSEGLQALLSNRCDVVVSDLMMEPMDGITFLTEALKIWPWLGVIVFSGYMQEDIYRQAESLGVQVILEKPLSFELLIRSVIDEAHRMRKRVGGQGELTLSRVLYQLNVLRDNTRTAIEAPSMERALLNLCRDLGMAIPSVLTAIMSTPNHAQQPVFAASLRKPIPPSFLPRIKTMIKERYTLLSGATLPLQDEAEWMLCGVDPVPHIASPQSDPLYFPIIRGNKITGLLLFIAPDDFTCSESDISFLYHAANHFTTVLTAFHRIRELAVRDELTGLYNRRHLQDELAGVWQMASRCDLNPAMLIMDIDHFKLINDNYGHAAGDEVMRALANIIQQACRSSDMIARYGGDEIIVVLPSVDRDSVQTVAARIQNDIREHVFCQQTHALHVTVSIGIASFRNASGELISLDALLAHADEALYTAKRNGRNRTVTWMDSTMQSALIQSADDSEHMVMRTAVPSIIVVDDDPVVLKTIKLMLASEKMRVQTFGNAPDALDAVTANPMGFDIALIDLHLAACSGLELVRDMHNESPFLVPIIITGDATLDHAVSSLRHGAYDFIPKPLQREHVKVSLDRALEYHRLRLENEEYQQNLESMVKRKSTQLTDALKQTRAAFDFTLRAMTDMLDAREHTTGEHSVRVQELTVLLARKFNFGEKELDGIRTGALLHDIGKIAVPDRILLKEGPLTEEESMIMRNHVEWGYELIKTNTELSAASDIMLYHHENFDGSGYPRGLKGPAIPQSARIFSVVDAYDAMRSNRPYRESLPREKAIAELQKHSGTQFDPNVVETFLQHIDEIEARGRWA